MAFEPVWLFVRDVARIGDLSDLAGYRVAPGARGSGSRAIAKLLLQANGVLDRIDAAPCDELASEAAANTLIADEVDAAFIVSGAGSPAVVRPLDDAINGLAASAGLSCRVPGEI